MLREGTTGRSSRDIAEAFDAHGVQVTIGEANDPAVMVIQATGLSDTFGTWFPIVADILTRASFPIDELTLAKRRLVADWQSRRSAPVTLANEVMDQALYGAEAAPPLDPNAIAALTSDQLKAWHAERYAPQNTVLAVAGAIETGEAEKIVRDALGGWAKTNFTPPQTTPPAPPGARVFIVNRPNSVQTTLMVGSGTVDRAHADVTPLVIANRVLGGGPTSRLFVKLREERGLTYGAFSNINSYKHGGDWRAWVDFSSARLNEASDAFVAELRRLGAEPVAEQELEDAKRSIAASFALTLEQLSQVVTYMTYRRGYGLSNDYWDRFPEKLMSISQADTRRVASQYMDMSKLQIVAVGDAAQLGPVLKPLGQVVVVK
jgi:predicted Zn-dependent peptidase